MNKYFEQRDICPCCLSASSNKLYSIPYSSPELKNYFKRLYDDLGPGVEFEYLEGANYIVQECKACGAIYQKDVPGPELMERLYEYWLDPEILYTSHKSDRTVRYFRYASNQILLAMASVTKPPAEIKYLDLGMGWGNWPAIAKGFGCNVYGVELSETRIKNAENLGIKILDHEDLKNHKFDIINFEQVLEHLAHPIDVLESIIPSLNKGGVIRACIPQCHDLKRRLAVADWNAPFDGKDSLMEIAPLQHINFFGKNSLLLMGKKAGMSCLSHSAMLSKYGPRENLSSNNNFASKMKKKLKPYKIYLKNLLNPHELNETNVSTAFYFHPEN